jgi:hypothetical protein
MRAFAHKRSRTHLDGSIERDNVESARMQKERQDLCAQTHARITTHAHKTPYSHITTNIYCFQDRKKQEDEERAKREEEKKVYKIIFTFLSTYL